MVRALMRAFDPEGILNPGNLVAGDATSTSTSTSTPTSTSTTIHIDRESLLVRVDGSVNLSALERALNDAELTLAAVVPSPAPSVGQWLAQGAPGSRDRWLDPVDHLVAGLDATLTDGTPISIRPAPRRAVGPDLIALFVGAHDRFGRVRGAWLRVHRRGILLPTSASFEHERDATLAPGERVLLDAIEQRLTRRPRH